MGMFNFVLDSFKGEIFGLLESPDLLDHETENVTTFH